MRRFRPLLTCMCLAAAAAGGIAAAPPEPSRASAGGARSWTADNGNGTYSNPLFYEEFEDPDVIRVGEDYYLAGTTMHMNPGLIVMHSRDLVNWQLAGYCIERLDFGPRFRLEGGNIYGQGIWAPCIRHHEGTFYVFANVNGVGTQVFRSRSPKGPWARNQLPGMHDLSVLFDDDGRVYAIYGAGRYTIVELDKDLTEIVPGSRRPMNAQGMGEGHHLYKIKGKYFDVSAIPGAHTDQVVARADSIDGPWQVERMVRSESLGVPTQNGLRTAGRGDDRTFAITPSDPNAGGGLTLHQGGIVDTPSGEWWSIIMQDHGSIGRMVALVPVTWDGGFPLIGLPGNLRKAPNTWVKPDTGHAQVPTPPFVRGDDFDAPKLNPVWQWNHVPDDSKWSLAEKTGVLRLHSLPAADFWTARNSLTQRPPGPECTATVELDASGLVAGDTAGLALLSSPYAWIGLVKSAEGMSLQTFDQTTRRTAKAPASPARLWLRAACNFDTEKAVFAWSADGKDFAPLGEPFTMVFQLTTFQGVRVALFNYNTSGGPGGHADFDNFTVDEPRASGIERTIPAGKTIVFASGADGSLLAVNAQDMSLGSIPSDSPAAAASAVRFHVLDLGKGRVALRAGNDRCVSVAGNGVVLKDLAGAAPGTAESFQWVNLMRGDTMLMSLANHRYLAVTPNSPGPVTASAEGPRPDRKGGACFKWKVVEADQSGPTLKDACKNHFLIGMAGDLPGNYSGEELGLVKEHFDIVTPENCMKPGRVHPGEDTWRFERPDALVQWCTGNGIAIHGHTLLWHAQTNDWFFRDGDKAAVIRRMKDHIGTLVGRYKGKIRSWDVVNEAIADGGDARTARTENLRNSSWLRAVGPEFLTLAFKFAHEADPDAVLYYNDYGIEAGPKHASSMVLLKRLIEDGAPIHGVGIQGHWSTNGIPFAALDAAIADYASLGLKVSITELDVTIRGASGGQFGRGFPGRRPGGGAPPAPDDLKAQADAYARLFSIFAARKDALERVTFWGLSDRRTWRFGQHPLLFDSDNRRKPAYAAVLDALLSPNPGPAAPR